LLGKFYTHIASASQYNTISTQQRRHHVFIEVKDYHRNPRDRDHDYLIQRGRPNGGVGQSQSKSGGVRVTSNIGWFRVFRQSDS
jgi:hypothetical protein